MKMHPEFQQYERTRVPFHREIFVNNYQRFSLKCAACEGTWTHIVHVEQSEHECALIRWTCETCPAETTLTLQQHKGETFVTITIDDVSWAEAVQQWDRRLTLLEKCQSPAEEMFLGAAIELYEWGLELEAQHEVATPDGTYRLDFALPQFNVGIEIDGHAYHSDADTFHNDRVRQRAIERAGWRICRLSGREVTRNAIGAADDFNTWMNEVIGAW